MAASSVVSINSQIGSCQLENIFRSSRFLPPGASACDDSTLAVAYHVNMPRPVFRIPKRCPAPQLSLFIPEDCARPSYRAIPPAPLCAHRGRPPPPQPCSPEQERAHPATRPSPTCRLPTRCPTPRPTPFSPGDGPI